MEQQAQAVQPQTQMSVEQAFNLLLQATQALQATRDVHAQIIVALNIIKSALPKEEKPLEA